MREFDDLYLNKIHRSGIFVFHDGNAYYVNEIKNVANVTDPVNQKSADRKWLLVDDAYL